MLVLAVVEVVLMADDDSGMSGGSRGEGWRGEGDLLSQCYLLKGSREEGGVVSASV